MHRLDVDFRAVGRGSPLPAEGLGSSSLEVKMARDGDEVGGREPGLGAGLAGCRFPWFQEAMSCPPHHPRHRGPSCSLWLPLGRSEWACVQQASE